MKSIFVLSVLAFVTATNAIAMDHRSQFGVGGQLGGTFAAPWASDRFRDSVGAKIPAFGAWVRYIPGTPEVGVELSYDSFTLSNNTAAAPNLKTNAAIVSFISRQNPWGSFHPFYGFGVGYSSTSGWFTTDTWETPVFKLIAGIEFEMNDRTDIGFHLNHYTIFKNKPSEGNMHALSPVLTITHYFGTPAPLPAAPAPAPTPAPAPAVSAPAPAADRIVEQPAPAPAPEHKAKGKGKAKASAPAKKAKKPAKKKKHSTTPPEATEGGN